MSVDNSVFSYTDQSGQYRTIRVLGHKMAVRKCLSDSSKVLIGDQKTFDPKTQLPAHLQHEAEQILTSLQERTNWCEVLAVGPKCGTPRDPAVLKKFNRGASGGKRPMHKCLNNPSRPGDFVVLPEQSERGLMWGGVTGKPFDLIVDEAELICICPKELAYA